MADSKRWYSRWLQQDDCWASWVAAGPVRNWAGNKTAAGKAAGWDIGLDYSYEKIEVGINRLFLFHTACHAKKDNKHNVQDDTDGSDDSSPNGIILGLVGGILCA